MIFSSASKWQYFRCQLLLTKKIGEFVGNLLNINDHQVKILTDQAGRVKIPLPISKDY
jgi:hypothetical protein